MITAYSSAGSRFKLLMFEQQADGQWELVAQVWPKGVARRGVTKRGTAEGSRWWAGFGPALAWYRGRELV